MAAFRLCANGIGEQPGGKPELDQEGLLPALGGSNLLCSGWIGGLRDFLHRLAGSVVVLRISSHNGSFIAAPIHPIGTSIGTFGRPVAFRVERAVPRRPIHNSLLDAVLD